MADLSLVAGNGDFPLMFVRAAAKQGVRVSVVGMRGEADPALGKLAHAMTWVNIGALQALIDALRAFPSRQVAFAGGIAKVRFFMPQKPDARGLRLLGRVLSKKDDGLLRALAAELEGEGMSVVASTLFLGEAMAPRGELTRPPTADELADVHFGFALAKQMGAADVGQTVVVKDCMPVAVEAIEGTDACIKRGGKLARRGAVVVKTLKPQQDQRFDLPAIGPRTIKTMRAANASVLGIEAGHVLIIDREHTLALARKAAISIVGV